MSKFLEKNKDKFLNWLSLVEYKSEENYFDDLHYIIKNYSFYKQTSLNFLVDLLIVIRKNCKTKDRNFMAYWQVPLTFKKPATNKPINYWQFRPFKRRFRYTPPKIGYVRDFALGSNSIKIHTLNSVSMYIQTIFEDGEYYYTIIII